MHKVEAPRYRTALHQCVWGAKWEKNVFILMKYSISNAVLWILLYILALVFR